MSKSRCFRIEDLRAIIQVVGDCRDLGDDPVAWRVHFLHKLAELVGACGGNCGQWSGLSEQSIALIANSKRLLLEPIPGLPAPQLQAEAAWGFQNGLNKDAWEAMYVELVRTKGRLHPMVVPYFLALMEENGVCRTRQDLVHDANWYRSRYFRDYHSAIGGDNLLYCHLHSQGPQRLLCELTLVRYPRERDFSPRDRTIVRLAHTTVAALIDGPLASFMEPSPANLSPRCRQVLRCLLEGDGDKQIARRIGISTNTVNQYMKTIFAHFSVHSRTELLARWIRRGWGTRCAWADGFPIK